MQHHKFAFALILVGLLSACATTSYEHKAAEQTKVQPESTNDWIKRTMAEQESARLERKARLDADTEKEFAKRRADIDEESKKNMAAINADYERSRAEIKIKFAKGPAKIGMSALQVMNSRWGQPIRINKTSSAGVTREQWVYEGNNYLYFENGKLRTIQESE